MSFLGTFLDLPPALTPTVQESGSGPPEPLALPIGFFAPEFRRGGKAAAEQVVEWFEEKTTDPKGIEWAPLRRWNDAARRESDLWAGANSDDTTRISNRLNRLGHMYCYVHHHYLLPNTDLSSVSEKFNEIKTNAPKWKKADKAEGRDGTGAGEDGTGAGARKQPRVTTWFEQAAVIANERVLGS